MNIEQWLFEKLGPLANNRVYGGYAPQKTEAPYMVFKEVSSVKEHFNAQDYWYRDRWQIDIHTNGNYTAGRELLASVKEALDVRGSDNGLCIFTSETDSEDLYDESVELHYQTIDLLITYSEEVI